MDRDEWDAWPEPPRISAASPGLRFRDRTVLDAVTAAAALVALADDQVCGAEKGCVTTATRDCAGLTAFDGVEIAAAFQRHAQSIRANPWGRGEALDLVAQVRGNPAASAAVLAVAERMAAADGPTSHAERLQVDALVEILASDHVHR